MGGKLPCRQKLEISVSKNVGETGVEFRVKEVDVDVVSHFVGGCSEVNSCSDLYIGIAKARVESVCMRFRDAWVDGAEVVVKLGRDT